MKKLYTAVMTASGGRTGTVKSPDGKYDFALSMPKELRGDGGDGVNPELLFAAGYSACFHSAMKVVAAKQKIDIEHSSVTASVDIGMIRGGGFGLAVTLTVSLPGMETEAAQGLVEAAHQVCPYSNATRNNIEVTLVIA
ncbi:organic hydroperoxide resistance protein [Leptospira ognonensis]|uniref:Organic hydroperoxide resistance protein n=1 Tax=Leptospira ognonensis TaxID=2484945 RepID=A0A4R9K6E9_9LEPT|nr:organic hydroperoxide resistance protein [Leptospira ognonensis]TGL60147.1 organic hydroperoxide resistance protein [Leptospira ognonensis]